MSRLDLGPIGVAVNVKPDDAHLAEAKQLEELGYQAIWLPGGQLDRLDRIRELVRATATARIASAIISPDVYDADDVAKFHAELQAGAPGRFVVGLGGSQKPRSLDGLNRYLDRLDQADPPVPAGRRLLAALGPRKLEIARTRCAGVITLLVTPSYTGRARAVLGADSTLVVDQFVVLDTDATQARETGRRHVRFLAGVGGYRANFARMGFDDNDVADLSDRLVDALVAWGDADAITARIDEHRAAGADHVVVSVISDGDQPGLLDVAERLFPAGN
jgi:probable F420-dependent oxidoreductase